MISSNFANPNLDTNPLGLISLKKEAENVDTLLNELFDGESDKAKSNTNVNHTLLSNGNTELSKYAQMAMNATNSDIADIPANTQSFPIGMG